MIAANYASSWVGYLILAAVKGLVQSITLLWLKPFFLVCLGVSFLLSLLIERPVVDGFFDVTVKAGNRLCDAPFNCTRSAILFLWPIIFLPAGSAS